MRSVILLGIYHRRQPYSRNFVSQRYFIDIDEVVVQPVLDENPYGLVKQAEIVLWCKLRGATLHSIGKGRYEVELNNRPGWYPASRRGHRNVFLDCPSRDGVYMANSDNTVCLVPVLKDREGDKICLILRLAKEGRCIFKRIGIVKLNILMDNMAMESTMQAEHRILEGCPEDLNLPHDGQIDDVEHRVRIHVSLG